MESKKDYSLLTKCYAERKIIHLDYHRPKGVNRAKFEMYLETFRNRIAFHSDSGHQDQHVQSVAKKALLRLSLNKVIGHYTIGDRRGNNNFQFASQILVTAINHEFWKIENKLDLVPYLS